MGFCGFSPLFTPKPQHTNKNCLISSKSSKWVVYQPFWANFHFFWIFESLQLPLYSTPLKFKNIKKCNIFIFLNFNIVCSDLGFGWGLSPSSCPNPRKNIKFLLVCLNKHFISLFEQFLGFQDFKDFSASKNIKNCDKNYNGKFL